MSGVWETKETIEGEERRPIIGALKGDWGSWERGRVGKEGRGCAWLGQVRAKPARDRQSGWQEAYLRVGVGRGGNHPSPVGHSADHRVRSIADAWEGGWGPVSHGEKTQCSRINCTEMAVIYKAPVNGDKRPLSL